MFIITDRFQVIYAVYRKIRPGSNSITRYHLLLQHRNSFQNVDLSFYRFSYYEIVTKLFMKFK